MEHNAANYEDDAFLRLAAGRYAKFLKLKGLNPRSAVVPTLPIDLMWHAHMLSSPIAFQQDTLRIAGIKSFLHDDDKTKDWLTGQTIK